MIPNRYLSFITGKIYNNELSMNVMLMKGSNYIFKKPVSILGSRLWQATCTTTTNKILRFLCLCRFVRLDQTFRVWWSWVGIINYTWILLSPLHGGGDKQASSNCKITGIHKFSSAHERFLQLMSTDMSMTHSTIQMRSEGIFTRALWIIWSWTFYATLAYHCALYYYPTYLLKNNSPITGQH